MLKGSDVSCPCTRDGRKVLRTNDVNTLKLTNLSCLLWANSLLRQLFSCIIYVPTKEYSDANVVQFLKTLEGVYLSEASKDSSSFP